MAMADGNATETVAAMVDGDRNSNGWGGRQRQWATAMATATATESATAMETAMAIAMVMAMARVTMTKGGLPLHVPAMCSTVAGVTPCLHPHGHKGVCIHQCCVMGVMLQRVFAPFQGGGFLAAHHGLFFIFYKYCSVY
jgi:hypothetical protein